MFHLLNTVYIEGVVFSRISDDLGLISKVRDLFNGIWGSRNVLLSNNLAAAKFDTYSSILPKFR
jgi:hypothetical protein